MHPRRLHDHRVVSRCLFEQDARQLCNGCPAATVTERGQCDAHVSTEGREAVGTQIEAAIHQSHHHDLSRVVGGSRCEPVHHPVNVRKVVPMCVKRTSRDDLKVLGSDNHKVQAAGGAPHVLNAIDVEPGAAAHVVAGGHNPVPAACCRRWRWRRWWNGRRR